MIPQPVPSLLGAWHPVTTAGGAGTGRRYGKTLLLRLATGGLADDVVVDDGLVRLAGAFTPLTYDALSAAAPLRATLDQTTDGAMIVQLDGARRLVSVRLKPSAPATSTVLVHRVDGRVRTDEPTLVVAGGSGAAGKLHTVSGTFVADRLALRRGGTSGEGPLTAAHVAAVSVTGDPANPVLALRRAGSGGSPTPLFTGALTGGAAFDIRALADELRRLLADLPRPLPDPIELELLAGADGPATLRFDVASLPYRLAASGFADLPLRESDVADADGLLARLRGPTDPVSAHLRAALSPRARTAVDARTEAALALCLADLSAALAAAPLWDAARFSGVVLSAEAAALVAAQPGGARRDRLNRLLLEAAWPGLVTPRREPRRLAVAANAGGAAVAVRLPPGVASPDGELAVKPFVEPARAVADGMQPSLTPGDVGLAVDGHRVVAATLDLEKPIRASGVEVAVHMRDATGGLQAELRADHRDSPAGAVLGEGAVAVTTRGAVAWARLRFDPPVVLQPGRSWVVLRSREGRAVWLAAAAVVRGGAVRVSSGDGGWEAVDIACPVPLVRPLTVPADGSQAVEATVGGTALTAQAAADGSVRFDLAAVLAGGGVVDVRLHASGNLVVAPPHVTYEA